MPIKFIDCFTVSTDVKHDAYKKADPNSTQGLQQDRVKIKRSTVTDCRRINVQQEQEEQDQEEQNEDQEEQNEDQEEQEQEHEDQEKKTQLTMKSLMESFRRYTERI